MSVSNAPSACHSYAASSSRLSEQTLTVCFHQGTHPKTCSPTSRQAGYVGWSQSHFLGHRQADARLRVRMDSRIGTDVEAVVFAAWFRQVKSRSFVFAALTRLQERMNRSLPPRRHRHDVQTLRYGENYAFLWEYAGSLGRSFWTREGHGEFGTFFYLPE